MLVFISKNIYAHLCGEITFCSSFDFNSDQIPEQKINDVRVMLSRLRHNESLLSDFQNFSDESTNSQFEYGLFVSTFESAELSLAILTKNSASFKASRIQFNKLREQLRQDLIKSGMQEKCCVSACSNADLTIDHKVPLRRGGSNDLCNLQFMCRSHNSKKGHDLSTHKNNKES